MPRDKQQTSSRTVLQITVVINFSDEISPRSSVFLVYLIVAFRLPMVFICHDLTETTSLRFPLKMLSEKPMKNLTYRELDD